MNWGYKIMIVYIMFVIGILFLVIRSSNEKSDLVTKDYYAQELQYQQKIDARSRTAALDTPVSIDRRGDELFISFPKEFTGKSLTGDVLLYCPADENKDLSQHFDINNSDVIVKIPPVNKGQFALQVSWQSGGVKYYYEKRIFI